MTVNKINLMKPKQKYIPNSPPPETGPKNASGCSTT